MTQTADTPEHETAAAPQRPDAPASGMEEDAAVSSFDTAMTINEIRKRLQETVETREAPATQNRRKVSLKVREAREKLTSNTGTRPAFDTELARTYAQNRLSSGLAMVILAGVVTGGSTLWIPQELAFGWMGAVLFTFGIVLTLCGRFMRDPDQMKRLKIWRKRFVVSEFIYAATWAAIIVPLAQVESEAARIFVLTSVVLVIAVSTMLSASLPPVLFAGSLPLSMTMLACFALHSDMTGWMIASVAPLSQLYFSVLGKRLFNNALENLQHRAEKDGLIVELEQAKANSDRARMRAEDANVAKSRFLATMSHELRTPLNAILGFSEVMKSEVFGAHSNPAYLEYANDIHSSGKHLLNLINEILDLSRIEAGRYELNEEAVQLSYIVEDCHHLLKLRAKNKGVTIKEEFEPELAMVWGDERAIRQVVLNLLSNAIKFTPAGGEIFLTVGREIDGGQFISVRDTGPGIPEEEIPVVLSSFGQGSLAIKTAEQGTGLGLPIVKGLVEMHGGKFELKSKVREGTVVTASLPANRVMTALAPVPDQNEKRSRAA